MKDLLQRLSERKWQMTPQRRVVAEVLAGEHVHLTADEIHERAVARLPEISRATAYNTLGELVALGEIREVAIGGRARRYDPNADATHQHLVCERCGLIRDVHPEGEDHLRIAKANRYGFTVMSVEVVFRGLCPACATAESLAGKRARRAPRRKSAGRVRGARG
jgi:Fe2+ or Zn2+ uptake regulation protein